ncbi:hypothetical protein [Bacillus thuringiensis]|uniref:Uncharacterized protein n=1 Tax=Bacillus thuringiensis TaxID=1428 RepID=A0A9X6Y793_BACTU|nr:hypothetical protein CON71_33260 [Bacillus thuringiensis]
MEKENENGTLVVNCGVYEFTRFESAVRTLEQEDGYEGEVWEMGVASGDLEELSEFSNANDLNAEIITTIL